MGKRTRLVLGSAFALAPAALLAAGCAGEVIGGDASCTAVCANVLACEGPSTDPGSPEQCATSCQLQQESCASSGSGPAFQAAINCVAALTCESPEQFQAAEQASCGSLIDELEKGCPGTVQPVPTFDSGFFDGPSIAEDASFDVEGFPDSSFDAIPFDVEFFDASFDASFDAGGDAPEDVPKTMPKDAGDAG